METANGYVCTQEKGQGRPLLLLHGYHLTKEVFAPFAEAMSARHRVICIDLPGFGKSFTPTSAWGVEEYADAVAEVLDTIGEADIVAHSFGARIAIKLAASGNPNVGRLLLTGAAGIKPRRGWQYYRKVYTYKLLRRFCNAERLRQKYGSPDYVRLSPVMRESFKKIIGEDLTPLLCRVHCPTLLVFGEKDTETPLYMAKKMQRGISGSALVVFEGAGHFCFLEQPNRFTAVARAFLE